MMKHCGLLLVAAMIFLAVGCQAKLKPQPGATAGAMELAGRVRDAASGEPISGATVTMSREVADESNQWRPVAPPIHLTTDSDGRFRFSLPPEQARNPNLLIGFDLRHPRYADTMGGQEPLAKVLAAQKRGERPWFADLKMPPGEEISGVVEDPLGRPLAGCAVDYSPQGQRYTNGRTKTDASGRFRFMVARGSTRNVAIVRPANYAMQTFELFNRRGDLGALRVQPGAVVTGIVRDDDGNPLADTYVTVRALGLFEWMTEAWIKTDAQGRYTLGPLKPGPYRLTVGDMRFAPLGVYVRADRARETRDFRPAELVTVRLKVIDEAGRPARRTGQYPRFGAGICGYVNGQWYNAGEGWTDRNGVVTLRVPKGLRDATMIFRLSEGRAVRWNDPITGEPASGGRIKLGTLMADVPQMVLTEFPQPPFAAAPADATTNPKS